MVLLYNDPDGSSIKEMSNARCSLDVRTATNFSTTKTEHDLEGKVTRLQKLLKEKEDTILKLKNELAMKKVLIVICTIFKYPCRGY